MSKSKKSACVPGKVTFTIPGRRWASLPLTSASGATLLIPLSNEWRNDSTRSALYVFSLTAAAKATIDGALRVPLRISRSCPPPCKRAGISNAFRKISAPIPSGPPTLCALIVIAKRPRPAKLSGTFMKLCTASVWTGIVPAISTTVSIG